MTTLPEIVVTSADYERLWGLLQKLPESNPVRAQLERELERAQIVEPEEISPDVVTMNSRVEVEDATSGERMTVTLAYPGNADFEAGRLSVLAPVGAALLGLRTGQTIDWTLPNGRTKRVKVISVQWQPEAEGELHL